MSLVITKINVIYEAIPGYLPTRAIHELLTEQDNDSTRTLFQNTCELNEIKSGIRHEWTLEIT